MMGPAWGYTTCGRGRIFDDGVLPEGWHPEPQVELTSEEWTKRDEWERGRPTTIEPDPIYEHGPSYMAEEAAAAEPAPRKRGRPRKVA